jgi:hypothetical protein
MMDEATDQDPMHLAAYVALCGDVTARHHSISVGLKYAWRLYETLIEI